jgi:cytochrome c-type protein NapB
MGARNTVVRPPAPVGLACVLLALAFTLAGVGCNASRGSAAPAKPVATDRVDPPSEAAAGTEAPRVITAAESRLPLPADELPMPSIDDVPPERAEALNDRAALRAYDGAPPVIPHAIEQMSLDCLSCHGEGPDADRKGAPKVPHSFHQSCTQCHVEELPEDWIEIELTENTFDGRPAPAGGHRAYEGAPPVVPHTTLMRSSCLSCHGPFGSPALQSDHTERRNCLQCHALSARLDQRSAIRRRPPLPLLPGPGRSAASDG